MMRLTEGLLVVPISGRRPREGGAVTGLSKR